MSNPLQDLSRIAQQRPAQAGQGHDLYTRPRSSGPPMEILIVVGMGVLIVAFLVWAMFRPGDALPPTPPDQPARVAAPAAPIVVQEWKQEPSPWARSSAATSAEVPGGVLPPAITPAPGQAAGQAAGQAQPKVWELKDALHVRVRVDADGNAFYIITNRAPATIVDLQLGGIGDESIVEIPLIGPGATVQQKLHDPATIRAARAGSLPLPTIWGGDFQE
jgi:hypothetical protein